MSEFRILVDECVSYAIVHGLRRRLSDVLILQVGDSDAPPKSTDDADLLAFCESGRFLFLSSDQSTLPERVDEHHRREAHTYGILLVGPHMTVTQVADELAVICGASSPEEWIDRFFYLPIFTSGRHW